MFSDMLSVSDIYSVLSGILSDSLSCTLFDRCSDILYGCLEVYLTYLAFYLVQASGRQALESWLARHRGAGRGWQTSWQ